MLLVLPSKKPLPNSRSSRFFPMLSSRSFIVLCFIVRSVIRFELIFVKGVRSVSRFTYFACGYPVISAPFIEKTVFCFSPLCCLCSSVKDQLTIFTWVYFCNLYSVSLIHLSILWPILHYLDYRSFTVRLKVRYCQFSEFTLQNCIVFLGLLPFT